ncbi:MarR family transcriptional regulator [Rhizobium jaguaris]|uniref:MarR family transcriptional regulator n=2 Tax=Rhizobium jaguaris TaxID=1312183 RepID=A0A387FIP7_9HYPH|nr:MarR family transcriptional regulator [Rhizobium jaguaris]
MHTYIRNMQIEDDLGPLACHCLATRQLARHVSKLYERHMAPTGITSTQFSLLNFLGRDARMTMNELAAAMLMDRTTLLRAVKPLQQQGLVISAPETEESRRLMLELSPAGRGKIAEAEPFWQAAQEEYESQVGQLHAKSLRSDFFNMTHHG